MKKEHISNIRKKDILLSPTKYLWLQVPEEFSNVNFTLLLDFIDKYSDYGKDYKYGNAYYRIRMESNKLLGIGLYSPTKTSKREIKSIRNTVVSKIDKKYYIKIPYKISYIFKAIIMIIDEIEKEHSVLLPNELSHTKALAYGIAFYDKYIDTYDAYYDDLQENHFNLVGYQLKAELYNDFHSENSVFNAIVK